MRVTAADCRTCGACCISPGDTPGYVDMSPEDAKKIPQRYLALDPFSQLHNALIGTSYVAMQTRPRLAVIQDQGKKHKAQVFVCAALQGNPGKACSCKVYEVRPPACRSFRPGSHECKLARSEIGL